MINKEFWKGTNFYVALFLAFGGLFSQFTPDDAQIFIKAALAFFAALFAVREKIKNSQIDWAAWLGSKNTWNYIGNAIIHIFPMVPIALFGHVSDLIAAILGRNWSNAVAATFAILTMLYYLINPKKATTATA